jgi:lysozyme
MDQTIWKPGSVPAVALATAQLFERWRAAPYNDGFDNFTIGWGSLVMPDGSPVSATSPPITREEGDDLLARQMSRWSMDLASMVTVQIAEHEAAALMSLMHNIGEPATRASSIVDALNHGARDIAAQQFAQFINARNRQIGQLEPVLGLARRRMAERLIFGGMEPDAAYALAWDVIDLPGLVADARKAQAAYADWVAAGRPSTGTTAAAEIVGATIAAAEIAAGQIVMPAEQAKDVTITQADVTADDLNAKELARVRGA